MQDQQDFTILDLASKWKSKMEFYNMLTREGGWYLPPAQDCTQKYLREVIVGEKLYLKSIDVKIIQVPRYEYLEVKDILDFAKSQFDVWKYLPKYKYKKIQIDNSYAIWFTQLLLKNSTILSKSR